MVAEMNRVGILCDRSHVGAKTSEDVIRASKKPVAYTHCLPAGLKKHPRTGAVVIGVIDPSLNRLGGADNAEAPP